jgi:hypothetical protein
MSVRTIGIAGVVAVVLGVGLLAVPIALADSPWDYPSVIQSTSTTPATPVRPDDRATARGPGAVSTEATVSSEATVSTTETGFDWRDASIGGAVVLGVVLLTGVAVWTATRHGHWPGHHAPT